jgi:hypothetical protein
MTARSPVKISRGTLIHLKCFYGGEQSGAEQRGSEGSGADWREGKESKVKWTKLTTCNKIFVIIVQKKHFSHDLGKPYIVGFESKSI